MFLRILLAVVVLCGWGSVAWAAEDCTPAAAKAKSAEPVVDWYDNYVRPYRTFSGNADVSRPSKIQIEAFIGDIKPFHRSAVLDPFFFEALAQRISASYTSLAGFKGIDAAAAEKFYKSGIGQQFDFSLMCITSRSVRAHDDAFAITLFAVPLDDCQHVGLRGLVFTDTLINGSSTGQCKPDLQFFRMLALPLQAGTNLITFVCQKAPGGCVRQ